MDTPPAGETVVPAPRTGEVGPLRWGYPQAYTMACPECGSDDRWRLHVVQDPYTLGERAWARCPAGHRVAHPLVYPLMVHAVLDGEPGTALARLAEIGWRPHRMSAYDPPDDLLSEMWPRYDYVPWEQDPPSWWSEQWPGLATGSTPATSPESAAGRLAAVGVHFVSGLGVYGPWSCTCGAGGPGPDETARAHVAAMAGPVLAAASANDWARLLLDGAERSRDVLPGVHAALTALLAHGGILTPQVLERDRTPTWNAAGVFTVSVHWDVLARSLDRPGVPDADRLFLRVCVALALRRTVHLGPVLTTVPLKHRRQLAAAVMAALGVDADSPAPTGRSLLAEQIAAQLRSTEPVIDFGPLVLTLTPAADRDAAGRLIAEYLLRLPGQADDDVTEHTTRVLAAMNPWDADAYDGFTTHLAGEGMVLVYKLVTAWASTIVTILPGCGEALFAPDAAAGEPWAEHGKRLLTIADTADPRALAETFADAVEQLDDAALHGLIFRMATGLSAAMGLAGGLDALGDSTRVHAALADTDTADLSTQAAYIPAMIAAGNHSYAHDALARLLALNPVDMGLLAGLWLHAAAELLPPGQALVLRLDDDGLPEAFVAAGAEATPDEQTMGVLRDVLDALRDRGPGSEEAIRHAVARLTPHDLPAVCWYLAVTVGTHLRSGQHRVTEPRRRADEDR